MIGSTLGHYRIVDRLGAGGMGEVFLAEDRRLGRQVAVKLLPEELAADPERRARLDWEARALAGLNHPNIVTLHALEDVDGRHFLVMEHVEGQTLGSLVPAEGLPLERFLELAVPLADALAAAHEQGVVHRDLKPANVMVTVAGRLKVLDFGLAKQGAAAEQDPEAVTAALTQEGSLIGTVPYMAPEQVEGRPADARSDVFSLGIVLHEMLAGQRPFRGDNPAALISALLRDPPPPLSELRPELPGGLGAVIARCLQKRPQDRYGSALEVRNELVAVARGGGPDADEAMASIAVLPFADMSPQKDQDYFCEGMAEEIINALTRIEGLRVAARTSSFQFRAAADVPEVGKRLRVETVLEGSVRKAGDRLRVTVQLIKVADGYHLWSERYDRQLEDVFAIQDEIAGTVVNALRVILSPRERQALRRQGTREVEAYEHYLRGRKLFHRQTRDGLEAALRSFASAIELDPGYALAYTGVADCHAYLFTDHERDPRHLEEAMAAAKKALELAPELAEAHASLGLVLTHAEDHQGADCAFAAATRLDPKLYEAYYFHGRSCFLQGRYGEAARLFEKAAGVQPDDYQALALADGAYRSLGELEAARGAAARSLQRIERRLEIDPADLRALYLGASMRLQTGDREGAFPLAARARRLGWNEPLVLYNLACFYSLAGDVEPALECLERMVTTGWTFWSWLEKDTDLDPLRDHPRFRRLLPSRGRGGAAAEADR
ncbi:MAG TPA: protein kinase [Thermoanaerobaculia bacterium]|nr:protein kinase [Thermoanaerobaculia bacterium]